MHTLTQEDSTISFESCVHLPRELLIDENPDFPIPRL